MHPAWLLTRILLLLRQPELSWTRRYLINPGFLLLLLHEHILNRALLQLGLLLKIYAFNRSSAWGLSKTAAILPVIIRKITIDMNSGLFLLKRSSIIAHCYKEQFCRRWRRITKIQETRYKQTHHILGFCKLVIVWLLYLVSWLLINRVAFSMMSLTYLPVASAHLPLFLIIWFGPSCMKQVQGAAGRDFQPICPASSCISVALSRLRQCQKVLIPIWAAVEGNSWANPWAFEGDTELDQTRTPVDKCCNKLRIDIILLAILTIDVKVCPYHPW